MRKLYLSFLVVMSFALHAQEWQQESTPDGFSPRNHPVTFAIGDVGYVLTGLSTDQFGSFVLADMWSFDPFENVWTQLANFPGGARGFAYGVEHDGIGYVGFGSGASGDFNDLWAYDPVANAWEELASCPCSGRRHPAMVAVAGTIYVGMGDDLIVGNLNDWWAYEIATDTWEQKASLPGPTRHHPFYFSDNGVPYVGFGHGDNTGGSVQVYDDFYRYNMQEDTWTILEFFPGEARVAGTQFTYNDEGYILSGEGSDHFNLETGEFYRYDSADDSWEEMPPHPGGGRWAPGTFVIGDRVYLIAGSINNEFGLDEDLNDMWSYQFEPPVSTQDVDRAQRLDVFPNPTADKLFIPDFHEIRSAEVFDANGRLVQRWNNVTSSIRTGSWASGTYILKVYTDEGVKVSKFAKS